MALMNILKTTAQEAGFQEACNPPASFPLCLPLCPLVTCSIALFSFLCPFCLLLHAPSSYSLPILSSLFCLFLVMLAPCRSCSMPSLTCLRAAVMKILRRRKILHGFSLGPGTPLARCWCVCGCVWV